MPEVIAACMPPASHVIPARLPGPTATAGPTAGKTLDREPLGTRRRISRAPAKPVCALVKARETAQWLRNIGVIGVSGGGVVSVELDDGWVAAGRDAAPRGVRVPCDGAGEDGAAEALGAGCIPSGSFASMVAVGVGVTGTWKENVRDTMEDGLCIPLG